MVPGQDMLSSLQTPDDHAWFDYGNMTSHDKEILNAVLYRHCEAFPGKAYFCSSCGPNGPVQATVEAQKILPAVKVVGPVQIAVETQRVQSAMHQVRQSRS